MTETTTTPATEAIGDHMKISDLLEFACRVTARQTALKDTVDDVRAELCHRAAEVYERDGSVPTWRVENLGTIPATRSKDAPHVDDREELASWLAQEYPEHAEGVISVDLGTYLQAELADIATEVPNLQCAGTLTIRMPAPQLPRALELLGGLTDDDEIATSSEVVVDPTWYSHWLGGLSCHAETVVDESGQIVPGMSVTPGGEFSVSLRISKEAKAAARAEVAGELLDLGAPAPQPSEPMVSDASGEADAGGDAEPERSDAAMQASQALLDALAYFRPITAEGDLGMIHPGEERDGAAAMLRQNPDALAAMTKAQLADVLDVMGGAVPTNLGRVPKPALHAMVLGAIGLEAEVPA